MTSVAHNIDKAYLRNVWLIFIML